MVTKDLQKLNLKFDQVMFNSLVFTWVRNFEVTFGIFSVLVSQINVIVFSADVKKLCLLSSQKLTYIYRQAGVMEANLSTLNFSLYRNGRF